MAQFIASYSYKFLIANVLSEKYSLHGFVKSCNCRLCPQIIRVPTDLGGLALE